MNESQTAIAHDSYNNQQEIPRAFNHNEVNAISLCHDLRTGACPPCLGYRVARRARWKTRQKFFLKANYNVGVEVLNS